MYIIPSDQTIEHQINRTVVGSLRLGNASAFSAVLMQEHNQKLFQSFILDFPWIISDCNVVICLDWIDI